jgi:hypothetical protein
MPRHPARCRLFDAPPGFFSFFAVLPGFAASLLERFHDPSLLIDHVRIIAEAGRIDFAHSLPGNDGGATIGS